MIAQQLVMLGHLILINNYIVQMKNIDKRTIIFYTYQNTPHHEYNIAILNPQIKQPKIKDAIMHLPLNLNQANYHFRFKSQFFEGDQKIVGWIDISNLLAKVPLYNNCIYVKILMIAQPDKTKLFSKDKLLKAGVIHNATHNKHSTPKVDQPSRDTSISPQPTKPNKHPPNNTPPTNTPPNNTNKMPPHNPTLPDDNDLFQFPPAKKAPPPQSPQSKLDYIQQIHREEAQSKLNEELARDELEDTINKWGYSGTKIINNLTTLLATLNQIWPSWEKVSLGDMLREQDVQRYYKKAVVMVHPDKTRNMDFRKKYLSKRVFELLNEAKKKK